MIRFLLLPAAMILATPAAAKVVKATPAGFESKSELVIAAPADRVWATLLEPARWWSGGHTYSGDATRLSLEARAGGCWCERTVDGGSVEHMRVVYVQPRKVLRMLGGLGPLQQEGVQAALTVTLVPVANGATKVIFDYVVGGYIRGGAEALAAPVDEVLGIQIDLLKLAAEAK